MNAVVMVLVLLAALGLAGCGGGDSTQDAAADAAGEAPSQTAQSVPPEWLRVATEGQSFSVAGTRTMRYGMGTTWVQKQVSGSGQCGNAFFGSDPKVGRLKYCEILVANTEPGPDPTPAPITWSRIAVEWQPFTFSGTRTVRYGVGTRWVQKTLTGGGECTNTFFGIDPAYGVFKSCELQSGGGDQAPVARIEVPDEGSTFRAGDALTFTGSGSDVEDGALPESALTWWAELHHDTHSHPFLPATPGASVTLTIPTRGETSDNIFYRVHLRVTDSAGATHEVTRDLQPQKAQVTLASVPAGLALTLDGQPVTSPTTFTGVVGIERDLVAPATQDFNGRRYRLASWSDGGAASHTIATPAATTTYTATYTDTGPVVNAAPTVALTAPAQGGSGTVGVPMLLAAEAADRDGSIAGVEFFENGVSVGSVDSSAPFGATWTPSTPGPRSLTARATDNAGAATLSAAISVEVGAPTADVQAPLATLSAPANLASGLSGTLTLTASATDNVAVTGVEFQLDGVAVGALDTVAPFSASVDTNLHASGQHVVRARARDAAGNWSNWASATVQFGGSRTQPSGFARDESWVTGLSSATAFAQAPDGRLFVAQQGGQLRVVKNGVLLGTPFVSLPVDASGERGLIGLALHPDFANNRHIYVYHTTFDNGTHNRISRFTASATNPDVAAAGSEVRIADLPALSGATNHNGGAMNFGHDGKLYVAVGDNANSARAPDLNHPFGKMLRFNDDGSIPADNPFCGTASTLRCAIWARGLRNPFTFAVRPGDGRIHINDVGEGTWEEVNLGVPGANYGWPASEGPTSASGVTGPLFAYDHNTSSAAGGFFSGCAITGGTFYPAAGAFPAAYRGSYYFTDFCTPVIGRVDLANGPAAYAFGRVSGFPVGLLTGIDGALYVLTQSGIVRFGAP